MRGRILSHELGHIFGLEHYNHELDLEAHEGQAHGVHAEALGTELNRIPRRQRDRIRDLISQIRLHRREATMAIGDNVMTPGYRGEELVEYQTRQLPDSPWLHGT